MRLFLILSFFILIGHLLSAQSAVEIAFKNLDQGAILIRLQTKQALVAKVEPNNATLANRIKAEQAKKNKSLIEAFSRAFKICPVYFFYSEQSIQVKDKRFDGILLDSTLLPVESVTHLDSNYLIAEYSQAKGDSMQHAARINTYDEQGDVVASRDTTLVFYSGYSIDALVLMDAKFNPMQKPYPRYVRQNLILRARSYSEMVGLLNDKIEKYRLKILQ